MQRFNKPLFIIILFFSSSIIGQNRNPKIASILAEVSLDSLTSYVRILSGEETVVVNGQESSIINRVYNSLFNKAAADYLLQKLSSFGLETEELNFSSDGTNIIAIQQGILYPDQYYIICGHYDSVTDYCADDNASGSAAVIEVARVLSKFSLNYSVIYALWDEEEIGLNGSEAFAENAATMEMDIKGVINLDMIGYDSNDDGFVEIHTDNSVAGTEPLYEPIMIMDSVYQLGVSPQLFKNGTSASDHASFLREGYPAVLIIEGLRSGDFNPYYHSKEDRINKFNLNYFLNVTKLVFISLANFVLPVTTNLKPPQVVMNYTLNNNYPNPFNPSTIITYSIPSTSNVVLKVYDLLGREVEVLVNKIQSPGHYEAHFEARDIPSGTYFYTLKAGDFSQTRKMLIVK